MVCAPRALLFEAACRDVAFQGRAFLAGALRAARGFRSADFFAELFFFFSRFAIDVSAPLIDRRRENGRLIKNISLTAQAEIS
jgi:hypothetical protein